MSLARAYDFLIQWHLTEKCNLKCKHCYQEGGQGRPPHLFISIATLLNLPQKLDASPRGAYFTGIPTKKGGVRGMKLGKEALAKEAAFWGKVKQVDPRKVCHK